MWNKKEDELYWEEGCKTCKGGPYDGYFDGCDKCESAGKIIEKVSIEKPETIGTTDELFLELITVYNTQLSYKKEILEALKVEMPDYEQYEADGHDPNQPMSEYDILMEKYFKAQERLKSYTYTNNQIQKI